MEPVSTFMLPLRALVERGYRSQNAPFTRDMPTNVSKLLNINQSYALLENTFKQSDAHLRSVEIETRSREGTPIPDSIDLFFTRLDTPEHDIAQEGNSLQPLSQFYFSIG